MNKNVSFTLKLILLITLFNNSLFSQENDKSKLNVTVYNNNLGIVKDVRRIDLKKGKSDVAITDVAELIEPTTVLVKFNGEVIEQNYQYDLVNLGKILAKYVDQDVELISEKDEVIYGKLLSAQGEELVLQKIDGGLLMLTDLKKYRISVNKLPEGLITRPTLLWHLNSNTAGPQDIQISYQTRGMEWHAEYVAVLNENDTKLDLKAWVSIANRSGMTFNNAALKLVAGDVNLVSRPKGYGMNKRADIDYSIVEAAGSQFKEKEFFEYHMYDLKRNTTLANDETKQISLFEAGNVAVTKKYLYRSGDRYVYNNEDKKKVSVVVEFDNNERNNLGIPMPAGKISVNKSDGEAISFVGEDMIEHTPKDEKIKLKIGDAFDVVVEEIQSDNKRISERVNEESYRIILKNRKKEDITVEVERFLGLNWEMLENSIEFKKKDAQTVQFNVPVKSNDETTLEFSVRYSY